MADTANPTSRYYCHQCNVNVTPLPDFICPRCYSGFIEEVVDDENNPPPLEDDFDDDEPELNLSDFLRNLSNAFAPPGSGGTSNSSSSMSQPGTMRSDDPGGAQPSTRVEGPQRSRTTRTYHVRVPAAGVPVGPAAGGPVNPLQEFLQQVITNMVAGGLEGPGGIPVGSQANVRFAGPTFNIDFGTIPGLPPFFQVLHGNPGDYAWGQGGLDAVITQLLNNLDSTGPPPMSSDDIKNLPTVEISEDQVAKNLQCSVCMEDFVLKERVRQLPCSHVYHGDCIIPWLEMHGTCPICRKVFSNTTTTTTDSQHQSQQTTSSSTTATSTMTTTTTTATTTTTTSLGNSRGSGADSRSGNSTSTTQEYFDINEYD